MPYTQLNWQDDPSTATPIDAANLNHMDQQYANVANDIWPGATDVDAALLQRYGGDSGWVDCPLRAGVGQQGSTPIQVRKIGPVVYARWGVATGLALGTVVDVADIPVGFRPTNGSQYASMVTSPNAAQAAGGRWEITTGGVIRCITPTVNGNYYLLATGTSWIP